MVRSSVSWQMVIRNSVAITYMELIPFIDAFLILFVQVRQNYSWITLKCGFIFCIYIPFNFNFTLIGLNDVGCLIRALKNSELEPKFEFIFFFYPTHNKTWYCNYFCKALTLKWKLLIDYSMWYLQYSNVLVI